ncbi:hypothetical protein G6011_06712 [Alternaria panax]|uniref:Asl1-like glycosyl hydrolase catalytic domain-containing protein n=1 Tax=Alternaria panax TaxID=48097 RepID=A0AAD4FLT8_9PLEO|nr:hypothetical protein G6011_06712 [Alternaria panax]
MKLSTLLPPALVPLFTFATPTPDNTNTTPVTPLGSSTKHDPLTQIPDHHRRGIAYNDVKYARLFLWNGHDHVTWRYNWDSSSPPSDAWFRYMPMLHSLREAHTRRWKDDAEAVAKWNWGQRETATWMLGFNEADNCVPDAGGSCIDVPTAVAGWKKHMQPFSSFNSKIYLGSPSVTNVAASDTKGLGWLKKFLEQCDECTVDFLNLHWYGSARNPQNLKDHVNAARKFANGLPIWLTEFRAEGTDDEVRAFLDNVMPWMDNSQDVHRYCYFMARPGPGMLINEAGDGLSDIGNEYNLYHVHTNQILDGANGERWWEKGQPA